MTSSAPGRSPRSASGYAVKYHSHPDGSNGLSVQPPTASTVVPSSSAIAPVVGVVGAGPARGRVGEVAVVAEPLEPRAQLPCELVGDGDPGRVGCLAEEQLVDVEDPAELGDRLRVVVDAEVDERVGEL